MKTFLVKAGITVGGAFAAWYLFFLCSIACELFAPSDRYCTTPQVWALQAAAVIFAPAALVTAVALFIAARTKTPLGVFPLISRVVRAVLILCALVNLLISIPAL